MKKVICTGCGWSWNLKDGGDDPYTCHKCGHDNTPLKLTPLVKEINDEAHKNEHNDSLSN